MSLSDSIYEAERQVEALAVAEANCDWASAMSSLNRANTALTQAAIALVEHGVHAGMSQKRMADLLGIPVSALRGAKREFAR